MYLFDTDTLSNLLAKHPSARLLERLREIPAAMQFTCWQRLEIDPFTV